MIKIQIEKSENNYNELIVSGHSNSAAYGENIVCASISVLTISIINGLTEICKIDNLEIVQEDGYIHLKINSKLSNDEQNLVNLFLETLCLSFKQIQEQYPREIELKIKEN